MLKISNSWVSVPQMAPYLMFILVCFLDKMHNGFTCPLHYHILLFRAAINFTRIRNIIRLYCIYIKKRRPFSYENCFLGKILSECILCVNFVSIFIKCMQLKWSIFDPTF